MSRALRRLLRPGGTMAFHVIHTAPDLSERDRRRTHRSGPWAIASRHAPDELMRRAGFVDIAVIDQTEQFRITTAAWIREWDEHRDTLVALYGEGDVDARQQERRTQLQAVDDGLLLRSLVTGRRPSADRRRLLDTRTASGATIPSNPSTIRREAPYDRDDRTGPRLH